MCVCVCVRGTLLRGWAGRPGPKNGPQATLELPQLGRYQACAALTPAFAVHVRVWPCQVVERCGQFEGSVVRCFRRLDELLTQLGTAASGESLSIFTARVPGALSRGKHFLSCALRLNIALELLTLISSDPSSHWRHGARREVRGSGQRHPA